MGRTNPTMRDQIRALEEQEWSRFRKTLRRQHQEHFDDLFVSAQNHADAIGASNPRRPMEGVLLSIALDQQREIQDLQEELEKAKEEIGVIAGRVESLEHRAPARFQSEPTTLEVDQE